MSKELIERRNDLADRMESIVNSAKAEVRGLTEEETAEFDNCEREINNIKDLLEKEKKTMEMENKMLVPEVSNEVADFANVIRGISNISKADGAVAIPQTVADRIIAKISDISPIFERATKYNAKGTFVIPYVDTTTSTLAMGYVTEGSVTATADKLASVQLSGQLAGCLTLVSKSLLNNTDVDLVNFVVEEVARVAAEFIEKECVAGSTNCPGLTGITNTVSAAAAALTADNLIAVQDMIADEAQANACWIMSKATKTAIRQLKDDNKRPLLQPDFAQGYGDTLLGRPVFTSENMDGIATGKTSVYYGDMSGLAIQLVEDLDVEVLMERYADQHQIGVVAFTEFNAKVANQQYLAKITHA